MYLKNWYTARGPRFIYRRGIKLVKRYGITPAMAIQRLEKCVGELARMGCAPTFPTPGHVVQRYPQFIRGLEDMGAEIAVHSYEHVDLGKLPVPVATQQLEKAIRIFKSVGLEIRGFRCPYLGWSEELRDALPAGMFDYSSNEAVFIETEYLGAGTKSEFFMAVRRFYQGKLFSENVCLPSKRPNLIEIPACVPDDLQLHDGLGLEAEEFSNVWKKMIDQIYARGELFTLMFHPELASFLEFPFKTLLHKATQFPLPVWVTRLREVSDWWREKSNFKVEIASTTGGLRLNFNCTPRATILIRGLETNGSAPLWENSYRILHSRSLDVSTNPRPLVGLAADVPERTSSFLWDQGYILDASETARSCGIFIDGELVKKIANEVELVKFIETSSAPLVRFWRWPNGAKSALCITGDLDALTLFDYAWRIFMS